MANAASRASRKGLHRGRNPPTCAVLERGRSTASPLAWMRSPGADARNARSGLNSLIDDLKAASSRFAELWDQRPVARAPAKRKTFRHPEVGDITLDCDALTVEGSALRLIVYTATPGSRDADTLALLAAVGLQSFA